MLMQNAYSRREYLLYSLSRASVRPCCNRSINCSSVSLFTGLVIASC